MKFTGRKPEGFQEHCEVFLKRLVLKRRGLEALNQWLWGATCHPFGPLSWPMIWGGLRLWDGTITVSELCAIADEDLEKAMREYC